MPKVIIACGLLHYPRRLPVLDELNSENVRYKLPKVGDYEESELLSLVVEIRHGMPR